MSGTRIRSIVIILVLILIAFYTTPIFMRVFGTKGEDLSQDTLLPWEYLWESLTRDEPVTEGIRFWSEKDLNLGLDLQGGYQLELSVSFPDNVDLNSEERESIVQSALETLRNRIDRLGVKEPSLQRLPGENRITIQLPGADENQFLQQKKIIEQTAMLEFMIVAEKENMPRMLNKMDVFIKNNLDENFNLEYTDIFGETHTLALADYIPQETIEPETAPDDSTTVVEPKVTYKTDKVFSSLVMEASNNPIAIPRANYDIVKALLDSQEITKLFENEPFRLYTTRLREDQPLADLQIFLLMKNTPQTALTGKYLTDVRVNIDQGMDIGNTGETLILLEFDDEGSDLFARITGRNVGKRLAIVLDNSVYIAPNITEKIRGGRANISGLTDEEANRIQIVLDAGRLPYPVKIDTEYRVGPSLGLDSIVSGFRAAIIGLILVVLFMAIYYTDLAMGLLADLALVVNLLFLLAALGALEATLTLPGIAGIILTIGMAVDANVLIFERIREERANKNKFTAVQSGFSRAVQTILDANITTLITVMVLYQFGTGPIRGFAVTLSLGIVGSLFSAVLLVKALFDMYIKPTRQNVTGK